MGTEGAANGFIRSPNNMAFGLDADNNQTGLYFDFANNANIFGGGSSLMRILETGEVGIGDSSPAAMLTVGNGDLFQVNSSGAIAAVVGITNTGALNTTVNSSTALTVAQSGSNYALQVDTSTTTELNG